MVEKLILFLLISHPSIHLKNAIPVVSPPKNHPTVVSMPHMSVFPLDDGGLG